ncbi:MAG: hypothetical protein KAR47_12810, partial [Planctomycetes bacterium]|nr:hypothetical protein [Planctomycetota bacterium]
HWCPFVVQFLAFNYLLLFSFNSVALCAAEQSEIPIYRDWILSAECCILSAVKSRSIGTAKAMNSAQPGLESTRWH